MRQGRPGGAGTAGRTILFVHLALSPVVFSTATLEGFESVKLPLLLLTAVLLLALGLHEAIARGSAGRWAASLARGLGRDPVTQAFGAVLAAAALSAAFSTSPRTSLLGAHGSHAGLLTEAAYLVLFLATRVLCVTAVDARRLLAAPVLAAGVASAYAVVQVTGLDPVRWTSAADYWGYVPPGSTMGNPNFLSAYLVMALPLTGALAGRAAAGHLWAASAVLAASGCLGLAVVVLCLSRGSWLAAACALGAAVLALRARPRVLLALGGALLAAVATAWLASAAGPDILDPVRVRLAGLLTNPARLRMWEVALAIFRDHPLTGSGLDTFQLAFQRHRTVEYALVEWNRTPLKPHNAVLQALATQGLPGLLALAGLGVALVRAAVLALRRRSREERTLAVAAMASVVGLAVSDLFSFTVAGCGTLLVTLAAALSRLSEPEAPEGTHADSRLAWVASVVLAALLAGVVFAAAGRQGGGGLALVLGAGALLAWALWETEAHAAAPTPAAAGLRPPARSRPAVLLAQAAVWAGAVLLTQVAAVRPLGAGLAAAEAERGRASDPVAAVAAARRAVDLDPVLETHWVRLGMAADRAAASAATADARARWLLEAVAALEEATRRVPGNAASHAASGRVLAEAAALSLRPREEAFAAFDRAILLDPLGVPILVQAAEAAAELREAARARRHAERALALFPSFAPAHMALASAARLEGDDEAALRHLEAAVAADFHGDSEAETRARSNLAVACQAAGRPEEALRWARSAAERAPRSPEVVFNMGRILEAAGRLDEARAAYAQVLATSPGFAPARRAMARVGEARP